MIGGFHRGRPTRPLHPFCRLSPNFVKLSGKLVSQSVNALGRRGRWRAVTDVSGKQPDAKAIGHDSIGLRQNDTMAYLGRFGNGSLQITSGLNRWTFDG